MTLAENIKRNVGLPVDVAQAIAEKKKIAYQKGQDDYKQRVKEAYDEAMKQVLEWTDTKKRDNGDIGYLDVETCFKMKFLEVLEL